MINTSDKSRVHSLMPGSKRSAGECARSSKAEHRLVSISPPHSPSTRREMKLPTPFQIFPNHGASKRLPCLARHPLPIIPLQSRRTIARTIHRACTLNIRKSARTGTGVPAARRISQLSQSSGEPLIAPATEIHPRYRRARVGRVGSAGAPRASRSQSL